MKRQQRSSTRVDAEEVTATQRMGRRIRELRHQDRLTLIQLAERTGLSHSFLSQVERGLAQPSMSSLHRIAQALGTTQDRLMAGAVANQAGPAIAVLRATEGVTLSTTDHDAVPTGSARQLLVEPGNFYPTEFVVRNREFGEFYRHAGNEFLYIAGGSIEVEVVDEEGECGYVLAVGDSLRYPGDAPHRWRVAGRGESRVLMVHTNVRAHPLLS